MELTSNPDILRVAEFGSKFFVNGLEMKLKEFNPWRDGDNRVFLEADKQGTYNGYPYQHVRTGGEEGGGRAVFEIEELIERLKTGNFTVS
jgi:hypothetical protein